MKMYNNWDGRKLFDFFSWGSKKKSNCCSRPLFWCVGRETRITTFFLGQILTAIVVLIHIGCPWITGVILFPEGSCSAYVYFFSFISQSVCEVDDLRGAWYPSDSTQDF